MRKYFLLYLTFIICPALFGQVSSEYCEEKFSEWKEYKNYFISYESMPVLKDGIDSLSLYLTYPENAIESGKEGVVTVWFMVNEDGKSECEKVIKSVSEETDDVAIFAIRKSDFLPATHKDEPVSRSLIFQFTFSLKDRTVSPGIIE